MLEISWQDFEKVELRAGTIVSAEEFPEFDIHGCNEIQEALRPIGGSTQSRSYAAVAVLAGLHDVGCQSEGCYFFAALFP